ncbi:M48 family metallopeptidase [Halobacterium yunchengense]|uniref:M48 family metallopeptidase n=1 Tax=Halobacterium yunchengense TaxID=3108497 RepID=UPI00300B6F37
MIHAVVLLSLPALAYAASRAVGVGARRAADRVTAAARVRRANRALQAVVSVAGVFAATDSRLDDAVAAAAPGPDAVGVLVALGGTVLVGGVLPALAVHLGTRPAWAAVTGADTRYAATTRRFLLLAAVVLAPAFVVVAAWLAAPPGLPGLAAVAAAAALVVAVLPPLAAHFGPVRDPAPGEAAAVPACADGLRVRVVETDRHPVANAVATGLLPGYRYVFVTDALFRTLDDDAVAAVVAHEAGHHHRRHVAGRLLASGLALAPLFLAATGVLDGVLLAAVLSGALLLAAGPLVRWTEFDADAYAARHVGAAAMERALATLADRGLVPTDRSLVVAAVSLHPAVGRRVERLRDPRHFSSRAET